MTQLSLDGKLQVEMTPCEIVKGQTTRLTVQLTNTTGTHLEDLLLDLRPKSWNLDVQVMSSRRIGLMPAGAQQTFPVDVHPGNTAQAEEVVSLSVACFLNGKRFRPPEQSITLKILEPPRILEPVKPRAPATVDIAALRAYLAPLDDVALESLLLDRFPEVYDKLSRGLRKDEKLNLLLDHLRRYPKSVAALYASRQTEEPLATNTLPDYKRRALEARRAALLEEYEAANAQLSSELSAVNRKRLERQLAALEREIAEVEAQLGDASARPATKQDS